MHSLITKVGKQLRRSERFLKIDIIYLTKGTFWLSLGHGVAVLSGFLVSLAFASLFPKESYGTYKFILAMVGVLEIFSLTQLGTSISQSVARGAEDSLSQGFRLNIKWSLGILLGGFVLSFYYYLNNNIVLAISFLIAAITIPVTNSAGLYNAFLAGKKDFQRMSFYGTIRNAAPVVAIIAVLTQSENLISVIIVYFLGALFASTFLYYLTKSAYPGSKDSKEDSGLLSYGWHLSVMEILGLIANQLDKIIIFHYLGAAQLAIYAFAIAPVEQLQGGKKIFSTLVLPKLTTRSFKEIQKSIASRTIWFMLYTLILVGVYVLLAPVFFKTFYPQYVDSIFYSQIYSLSLIAIATTLPNGALLAHKKNKELYFLKTMQPVVKIALFLILLPQYGILGLITAHVVARFIGVGLNYYFVWHPLR